MKVVIVLCSLLFVTSSVVADKDDLRSSTEEREEKLRITQSLCPTPDSKLYVQVTKAGSECVRLGWGTEETMIAFRSARTLEQFRNFFMNFCQKQTAIRTCLNETTVNAETCRNETFLNTFKIYRDTIERVLDIGCNEDGEKLATLWFRMSEFVRYKQNINHLKKCANRYELTLGELERSKLDISSKLFNLHREIMTFVECVYHIESSESFKEGFQNDINEVTSNIKCIHPRDGALVPCVSIDANLVSVRSICDLKTSDTEMSLYDVLEEDFGTCMSYIFNYSEEDMDNNDKIRDIVERECGSGLYVLQHCYNRSSIMSEVCLNGTQQHEHKLFGDFIKSVYESTCVEVGRRVSEMMYEVYRLERTGHGHAVLDCIDVAQSTRNVTDEHRSSSKNMRFYHEMEAFKECLVDKLRGDQTSVDAATSLIDELLKKVKCVHPEEGTTVLCETLVNKTKQIETS